MKRLTKRDPNWPNWPILERLRGALCASNFCTLADRCDHTRDRTCPYLQMVDRLAAIEDILGDEYELDRLRELVEVRDTLKEFAEDVARQFGYHGTSPDGRPAYTTGGLSTLEWAWSLLGWPDPRPAPECECQEDGCHEWATGGRPTPDGYKWLCSRHFSAYEARAEAEAALRREQDEQQLL